MIESANNIWVDDNSVDGNIPEGHLAAQRMLDAFVDVAYDAIYPNISIYTTAENESNLLEYKRQVIKLISDNPPLQTVPAYFKNGRENYLWYSDFLDNVGREVLMSYNAFMPPVDKITPANYAKRLAEINLPYFRELVELVGLLKMIGHIESRLPVLNDNVDEDLTQIHAEPEPAQPVIDIQPETYETVSATQNIQQAKLACEPKHTPATEDVSTQFNNVVTIKPEPVAELPKALRSYKPNMASEQYSLLVKCINHLEIFRSNIKVTTLREMFEGKAAHTFQVTNQKSLTYLFDRLAEKKFIKKAWPTVATENRNFASARRRDGSDSDTGLHFISRQQFSNSRLANKSEWISGLEEIDDLIDSMTGE